MFTQFLFVLLLIIVASAAYAGHKGAPWVPTWKKDMARVKRLLDLQPGDAFVELGCGNGRVTRHLAKTTDVRHAIGVELSLLQWLVARLQSRLDGTAGKTAFVLGDAFKHDLSEYDAVYLFLMPEAYKKIVPKFEQELKPGARVVTYIWPIPGWEPTVAEQPEGASNIYLYQRPL